jgi:magnesium transporter
VTAPKPEQDFRGDVHPMQALVESSRRASPRITDCELSIVSLDFEHKREISIPFERLHDALGSEQFLWIDLCAHDVVEARALLSSLGLLSEEVIEFALCSEPSTRAARYEGYLHLMLSVFRDDADLERLDLLLSERFLLSIHRRHSQLLKEVRQEYKSDFVRFAKTPSFLIYEIWDKLIENYLAQQKRLEERVELVQNELKSGRADEALFSKISDLGADLLHCRQVILPARTVLSDLATRRSLWVSEVTQGFLSNLVGTVEHLLGDLLVDRELLSESLNLYMSIVSHRTNEVMKRLTMVSVVFLPLTFIVGVYGMNFHYLPELEWRYGYGYFWGLVTLVVSGLLVLLRRARWL